MIELPTRLINLDDNVAPFSVGGTDSADLYRGRTGIYKNQEVSLDILADNIAFLCRTGGENIRWLCINNRNSQIPHDRVWKAITPIGQVPNISRGYEVSDKGIDTHGFQGNVDYVLINHLDQRRMVVCACFDNENDLVLWQMRQPPKSALAA
jgi:hypothetical protein